MPIDHATVRISRSTTDRNVRLERARQLAEEIQVLLDEEEDGYAVRLAQAMTRSLVDQLADVERVASSRPGGALVERC